MSDHAFRSMIIFLVVAVLVAWATMQERDSRARRIAEIARVTGCRVQEDVCAGGRPFSLPNGRYSTLLWLCPPCAPVEEPVGDGGGGGEAP